MAINNVILFGRIVRDPELRYTSGNNTAMCRISLAVDRGFSKDKRQEIEAKGGQTVDFINCTAFGKTAELISNYVSKGQQLGVQGRIQTGSYTNNEGVRIYTTDVLIERIEFISGSQGGNRNQGQSNYNNGATQDVNDGSDMFPVDFDPNEIPF